MIYSFMVLLGYFFLENANKFMCFLVINIMALLKFWPQYNGLDNAIRH